MAAKLSSQTYLTGKSLFGRHTLVLSSEVTCNEYWLKLIRPLHIYGPRLSDFTIPKNQNELEKQRDPSEDETNPDKLRPKRKFIDTTSDYLKKKPSRWDKQILMYGSRYNSIGDIPAEIRLSVLNSTYDRCRVYFMMYTILMLCVLSLTIIQCGSNDVKTNDRQLIKQSDDLWDASEKKYSGQMIERKTK